LICFFYISEIKELKIKFCLIIKYLKFDVLEVKGYNTKYLCRSNSKQKREILKNRELDRTPQDSAPRGYKQEKIPISGIPDKNLTSRIGSTIPWHKQVRSGLYIETEILINFCRFWNGSVHF